MKILSLITLSIILSLTVHADSCSSSNWLDFTQEQVLSHLNTKLDKNTVAVRIKGLVCESCGLGIRRKISRLKSVDKKRLNKGVEMDVRKMLLIIALKEGMLPTVEEIKKAIDAAGYEAVYYYQLKNGKAVSTTL